MKKFFLFAAAAIAAMTVNAKVVNFAGLIDKTDAEILRSLKGLLIEVERQNVQNGVEVVETPPVERAEVSEDTPIRTEDREKVGMFRRIFDGLGKRKERTESEEETVSEEEGIRRAA